MNNLVIKLNEKRAIVDIVGLGYVGLPLILRFCEVRCKVIGFHIDQLKIDSLRNGESYIGRIFSQAIKSAVAKGIEPTTDFSRASEADALILCVPEGWQDVFVVFSPEREDPGNPNFTTRTVPKGFAEATPGMP